jgi:predicted P-loop ATPase
MVRDDKLGRDVKKRDWEIDLFGPGKQAVLPPSVHPDTGLPYRWERKPDYAELTLGLFPRIPASQLEELGIQDSATAAEAHELKPPLGLTEEEAEDIINALPLEDYCEDRDGWLQVGMALHHEFGGDEVGYELWKEFSQQSDKFNEKDQRIVWNSFRQKPNSVRMATLKAVANQVRLLSAFDDDDDDFGADDSDDDDGIDDDIDALIGTPSTGDDFESALSAGAEGGLSWISLMDVNEDGAFRPTLHNVKLIVCNDPRLQGVPQRNLFTQDIHQRTQPGFKDKARKNAAKPVVQLEGPIWNVEDKVNGDIWVDDKDFAMRALIEAPRTQGGYGIKVSDRDLKAAIAIAANDHSFHPVREYLESLEWDGKPRMENLFVDYLGAPPNAYTTSVGRLMMLGAVTRIYEPGHKFDFAVILEGLQGRRKSTFIRILGKSWSSELDGDFHEPKSMVELMMSKWILELPELSGFARADVRAIKAFLSRTTDRVRLAYARRAVDFKRQCILIGSTNDREYLKDDTGGRRFWPMPCHVQSIDTDRLIREIDQLWAEALAKYREMRAAQPYGELPLYLTDPEAQRIAGELQESRREHTLDDEYAGIIREWLRKPIITGSLDEDFDADDQPRYRDKVCLPEIWVKCLGGDLKAYPRDKKLALGRVMSNMAGWEAIGTRNCGEYGPQRTYRRLDADEEIDVIG